nr:leucine-rich repeat extensin-like protein 1 [Tanacetum cinerariifolium]
MTKGKEKVHKMKGRQSYRNVWHTDLMSTMAADTPYCCFALFCGPCASYKLRKRALYDDMSRYTCCGGYMPCSGKCCERKCPTCCLCAEVFLCFGNSVASTRFMLQDEFNIQTTKCDNWFALACRHNTRLKWTKEMENSGSDQWKSHLSKKCYPPHGMYGPPPHQGYPPPGMYGPPQQGYPPPGMYGPPPQHGYPPGPYASPPPPPQYK